MTRNEEDSSGEETVDDLSSNKVTKNLSCPSCDATGFSSLSKLNKHRNGHERPYDCLAEGCSKRFAQRQTLDRHIQSKHGDASKLTKYYHCTVDGCKYASTGQRQKRFARADQAKEHAKNYGHWGPHSANDRPRRRAGTEPLFEEHILTARFEEWVLDGSSYKRTVRMCEYNSVETKLWHKDVIGDMFVKAHALEESIGHGCPVPGCYYHQSRPPENCHITLFKTMKGLQEHRRRAHGIMPVAPALAVAFRSQLHQDEERGSVSSSDTMASTDNLLRNIALSSTTQTDQPWLTDLDVSFGTRNFESVQCFNPECIQYRKRLQEDQQAETYVSDDFYPGDQSLGWCQSCFKRGTATFQPPGDVLSLLSSEHEFNFEFTSISSSSNTNATTSLPTLNISEDNMQTASSTTDSSTPSLGGEDSLKLRKLTCTFPGCRKTFRRNYEFQRHITCVHSPATIYCSLCNRPFRRKDKLTEHIRHAHSISSGSDSTKAKAMFNEWSILSDPDWLYSSTFPSSKDTTTTDRMVPVATDYATESVYASTGLQSYSLLSEEWPSWVPDWQSTTAKSTQSQIDTPEAHVCVEYSPPSFSMNEDMCNHLDSQ